MSEHAPLAEWCRTKVLLSDDVLPIILANVKPCAAAVASVSSEWAAAWDRHLRSLRLLRAEEIVDFQSTVTRVDFLSREVKTSGSSRVDTSGTPWCKPHHALVLPDGRLCVAERAVVRLLSSTWRTTPVREAELELTGFVGFITRMKSDGDTLLTLQIQGRVQRHSLADGALLASSVLPLNTRGCEMDLGVGTPGRATCWVVTLSRVHELNADLQERRSFSRLGDAANRFAPCGLVVNASELFIADIGATAIDVYSMEGQKLRSVNLTVVMTGSPASSFLAARWSSRFELDCFAIFDGHLVLSFAARSEAAETWSRTLELMTLSGEKVATYPLQKCLGGGKSENRYYKINACGDQLVVLQTQHSGWTQHLGVLKYYC